MRARLLLTSALCASLVAIPVVAGAADIRDTLGLFNTVLKGLMALFITLAVVVFFWGLISYLFKQGEDKSEGLKIMFYGILVIFVMVSIWGIIALLQNTFKVGGQQQLNFPTTPDARF